MRALPAAAPRIRAAVGSDRSEDLRTSSLETNGQYERVAILRAAAFFRNFFQSMGDQCRPGTPQQFNYMTTRAGAGKMKEIQIKDAKARLSSLIDAAMRGQAAIITRRGKRQAVLLSFKEWERL